MYLDFINVKQIMSFYDVNFCDTELLFYVLNIGALSLPHKIIEHLLNCFKNVFNIYYAQEYRRIKILNFKNLKEAY